MTTPLDLPGTRRRALLGLGVLGLAGCATRGPPPPAETGQVVPFSAATEIGSAPAGWTPYVLRRDRPATRYAMVNDRGRPVLHAHSASAATGLRCSVAIDPRIYPLLRFSWRVGQAPAGASVEQAESDDCPARLVLGFDGDEARLSLRDRLLYEQFELFTGHRLPYATLMYVWDGALAAGSLKRNHRTGRIQYLAVESGSARVGRWLHYERDVVADYRRAFGEAPGPITSVGVLTDSDALKLELEAWYGDIGFGRRQT